MMNRRAALVIATFLAFSFSASPHAQELLVSSFDGDEVLRYNGESGLFIDVFASGGGLDGPLGMVCHTDGNLYVGGFGSDQVHRYNSETGEFIDVFASGGGLAETEELLFGPDGHLYVSSFDNDRVVRFDGTTGAPLGTFASGGGLQGPAGITWGRDGNLYVGGFSSDTINRYDGATGAFIDVFASGGGLDGTEGVIFGPDGHLYVASFRSNQILRYNGESGAFMGVFASGGGLDGPVGLAFGPDGNLYVGSWQNSRVIRYNGTTGSVIDTFISDGRINTAAYPVFCGTRGIPINPGLNDAWFNVRTAGQGLFVTVYPDLGAVFVAVFTYDTERPPGNVTAILGEPGHRWFTAFGFLDGFRAVLQAELTQGGVFNAAQPMPVQTGNYGTVTVEFHSCTSLTLTYRFPTLGLVGRIHMTRIALDNVPGCEELATR